MRTVTDQGDRRPVRMCPLRADHVRHPRAHGGQGSRQGPAVVRTRCSAGCGCRTSRTPLPRCWSPIGRNAGNPWKSCGPCSPWRSPATRRARATFSERENVLLLGTRRLVDPGAHAAGASHPGDHSCSKSPTTRSHRTGTPASKQFLGRRALLHGALLCGRGSVGLPAAVSVDLTTDSGDRPLQHRSDRPKRVVSSQPPGDLFSFCHPQVAGSGPPGLWRDAAVVLEDGEHRSWWLGELPGDDADRLTRSPPCPQIFFHRI